MNFSKRIQSEYKSVKDHPVEGITMQPTELSLFEWDCTIRAPENSPYYNSLFKVKLFLPNDYPLHAPKAKFVTRIFHPNIHYETGEVCLDILKSKWTPVWNLESVCLAIQVLLSNPVADSPLNCDAANIVRSGDMLAYSSLASILSEGRCDCYC